MSESPNVIAQKEENQLIIVLTAFLASRFGGAGRRPKRRGTLFSQVSANFFASHRVCAVFAAVCCIASVSTTIPALANTDTTIGQSHLTVSDPEVFDFLRVEERLETIALRIAMAADGQCASRWRHPGFKTHKIKDYPRSLRSSLRGFANRAPHVLALTDLQFQNQIHLNDKIVDPNGRALDDDSLALQVQLALGRLMVLRGDQVIKISGTWPQICYRPIRLTASRTVEARTAPNAIEISMGLIGYVQSDDELAYAIAHELSHFMLDHSRILSEARQAGRLTQSLRRDLEMDADVGAVFLLVKAGYDPGGALSFIDRSSLLRDFPLMGLSSHPRRSERLALVDAAIARLGIMNGDTDTIDSFVSVVSADR